MAGSLKTTNYQLAKYAPNDITSWLTDFNGNMDLIDAGMEANKQAAEQAQDGVTSLESEYESLLNVVASNTTSIDANEKAIAANSASIEELGDEVSAINIGDVKLLPISEGTKLEDLVTTCTVYGRRIGNFISGVVNFNISAGTTHTYNRQGTGILDGKYITDLVRFSGNPFGLSANIWSAGSGLIVSTTSNNAVTPTFGIAYLSESNYTVVGLVLDTSSSATYETNLFGVVVF